MLFHPHKFLKNLIVLTMWFECAEISD